jgi:hypothetical protein
MNDVDENDALSHLDKLDAKHGVNKPVEEATVVERQNPVESLGTVSSYQNDQLSAAEESPWKLLSLNLLPSEGMFYPDDAEILLRSAKTAEIKHWSTMDELDPIDVRSKINFVLNKCAKFKSLKGGRYNFNDYSDVDKYHLLFRIYELTFPNQENKLMANLKCKNASCQTINRIQVSSKNLIGYSTPESIMNWYDRNERAFIIPEDANKLGERFKFYLPNSGTVNAFRKHKKEQLAKGKTVDDAFYEVIPYLFNDWRNLTPEAINSLIMSFNDWSRDKFIAVHKFVEMIKKVSLNKATGVCEKCKSRLEDHIFLGGSFTTKDIFIISAGFFEFIGA